MFRNYLLIAFRNFWRNRAFSIINIAGLTLGLSISITIWIWIRFEYNYDDFHVNKDRIFLLEQTIQISDGEYRTQRGGGAYGPALENHFPEIRKVVRLSSPNELLLSTVNQSQDKNYIIRKFIENKIIAADSTFFELFSFPLLEGNPETVLKDPYSIVITESMARKYFGKQDPLGETIRVQDKYNFTVTGVAKDIPENSSIQFDFLIPFGFMKNLGYDLDNFGGAVYFTFVLLQDKADYIQLNRKIPGYLNSLFTSDLHAHQFLSPLKRLHLYGEDRQYLGVYLNFIMAFMILLIACINYVNLSTARALNRAKEVGLRKVSGASRWQLILQFLGESLLITIISMNLSLLIVERLIRFSGTLINLNLASFIQYKYPQFIIDLILITLITAILAGAYPAFILSSFKPAVILKSKIIAGTKGGLARKVLVVVQYTFSILFIITTIVVFKQFNYLTKADPGISKDNIFYFRLRDKALKSYPELKVNILKIPLVQSITTASEIPINIGMGDIEWGSEENKKNVIARIMWCCYDFPETFNVKMKEGRFYSQAYALDSTDAIVINDGVAKIMGWNEPVGKQFRLYDHKYTVIGIIDRISFFPFNIGGKALILPFGAAEKYVYIRLKEGWTNDCIESFRSVFEEFNPSYPFEYGFLKDYQYDILKHSDQGKKILIFFSFLGIFVSCLGLLGLAVYVAEQKQKEISIRMAFGSSATNTGIMFIGQFSKLVLIANLIGLPISYFLLRQMLQIFNQRTSLSWWIFAVTVLASTIFSILTVFSQVFKATGANPADQLRYE